MLLRLLTGGDLKSALIALVLSLPAIMLCLTVHEMSHGLMAYALGDNSAKNAGRLTLDPFAHVDPAGFFCMMLFGFGWAKPVPVNISNFKNKPRDMALTAFAGPLSNMILAFIAFLVYIPLQMFGANVFLQVCALFFSYTAQLSIGLGIFNLIPVYPFDGSRILNAVLPLKTRMKVDSFMRKYQTILTIAVIAFVYFGGLSIINHTLQNRILRMAAGVYEFFGIL